MTHTHDNRMNIGAKCLSGESYKGHTFWDTEIFLLPYFIFNMPKVARSLEEYRYLSLPGARQGGPQRLRGCLVSLGKRVDDNSFTNYLVWWTLKKAIQYCVQIKAENPELYAKLDNKLGLATLHTKWAEIDLTKYKKQATWAASIRTTTKSRSQKFRCPSRRT